MANQIALRVLAQPGDVVVAGRSQHVVGFEMGAASRNAAIQFATVDDSTGTLALSDVLEVIDSENDHQPHVALVCVENTHMASGGVPWDVEDLRSLASVGRRPPALPRRGATLQRCRRDRYQRRGVRAPAIMVMSCLSKGLCAPVGSLLAGPAALIERSRVERKRFGGAMRQAGFLAAAGLVALDTMVDRLKDDHARARQLADLFAAAFPESNYDTSIVSDQHRLLQSSPSSSDRGRARATRRRRRDGRAPAGALRHARRRRRRRRGLCGRRSRALHSVVTLIRPEKRRDLSR